VGARAAPGHRTASPPAHPSSIKLVPVDAFRKSAASNALMRCVRAPCAVPAQRMARGAVVPWAGRCGSASLGAAMACGAVVLRTEGRAVVCVVGAAMVCGAVVLRTERRAVVVCGWGGDGVQCCGAAH